MAPRDYYDILGVPRTASPDQIRSAYRRLARKHHPDVSKAKDAADRFKEATAAYEVLSDPEKRKRYDQFGHAAPWAVGRGGGPGGGGEYTWSYPPGGRGGRGGQAPFGGADFEDLFSSSPFAGMSLEELLDSLAGGRGATTGAPGAGRRGRGPAPAARGGDLEYPVTLEFLQAVKGTTLNLQQDTPQGRTEYIDVKIPAGVKEGSRIRVRGKGNLGPAGPGDLYIVVHVREHPYFRREDSDIYLDVSVSLTEAALGATVTVPTIDGPAELKIPPGAASGTRLRMRGRGVPDPRTGARGDQFVVVKIVLPKTFSQRGQQLLRELVQSDPYNPREKTPW